MDLGKSLDHFAPIGPNIVSPDDLTLKVLLLRQQ